MRKKIFLSVFILVTLFLGMTFINPSGNVFANNANSDSKIQVNTPTPVGQIEVPAVNLQFYAPATNPLLNTADSFNRISGFLPGIWHGAISPGTLIMSFLNSNIQMYAVHNDGAPYNLGFLIGVGLIFLILGLFAGSRRRRRL
ncbi:MAG TPA: hypothetical protein VK856_10435 [Anaerolineaceae bacterium]|nr:hypothetical protein [Anaerolineaceae bacterium]